MSILLSKLRCLSAIKTPQLYIQTAGLKSFEEKFNYDFVEYPERRKLTIMPKVPTYPSNLRPFKMQKRVRDMRGPELLHNTLLHKQYGIVATGGGSLRHGHFEMVRLTLGRKLPEKGFSVWRISAPWKPVTKKSAGVRMGGGKGSINHYVTPVKAGRVIIEVGGAIEFTEVKRVLFEIAHKLPFKATVVSHEELEEKKKIEQWYEENNQNYWTYKYIVQNNLLGCSKWICPTDRYWFGKHQ